jgi:transposase-like protein
MSQALVKALQEVQPEENHMEPKKRSKRRAITKAELKRIVAMRESGMTVHKIAQETGRAVSSVWRVLSIEKTKKETPSFLRTAPTHTEVVTPQNVIPYNISPIPSSVLKPVTQEKEAGRLQRMAISFCRFLGVTDNMYGKH